MTAKKTTTPAPVPGESLEYKAALLGLDQIHHKFESSCRSVAFLYMDKCISDAERKSLICFVVSRFNMLPLRVEDCVKDHEGKYLDEVARYKKNKS